MKMRMPATVRTLLFLSAAILPIAAQAQTRTPATQGLNGEFLLQADDVTYDTDTKIITAQGHVEIENEGRTLLADQVSYDQKNDIAVAKGHVILMDGKGNVTFINEVRLTDKMRNGTLSGFGALIGGNGRLVASNAERTGPVTVAYNAAYTPCQICVQQGQTTPVWQVKADRVVHDETTHRVRFKNARMELFGVPVFYAPYLSEPDPTVKYSSGILTPDAGTTTKTGYFFRVPVYVAISDTSDATIAPMFTTTAGQVLEGEYRKRWDTGGMWLQGSVARNPDGFAGGTQIYSHLFGSGRMPLTANWQTGFDMQLVSQDAYLRFYDISQLDRLTNSIFVQGNSGRSRFLLSSYYFQGLRSTDNDRTFPLALPLLDYTYIPLQNVAGGQLRVDLNSAAIARDQGPSSQRVTAEASWHLPITFSNGQLVTFTADARGDTYHIDNNDLVDFPLVPTKSQFVSRAIPYVAVDWRWPFVKSGSQPGYSYLIEPIVQAIGQPYGGNPTAVRALNEDSVSFEYDENSLFSFSHVPGYDLVESGPRANVGVRAEANFPGGSVEGVLGQTYRVKSDPIFAADSGMAGTASDVVGRISVKFPPYISVVDRLSFDKGSGSIRRQEVYVLGTFGRSSLQVSYVNLPKETLTLGLVAPRQEVTAQADLNLFSNWQAFAAIRRNLNTGSTLDSEYGLGYEDDCLGLSVAYRRHYTGSPALGLPPSTSVILKFSLKTGGGPVGAFSLFPQDVFANRL